jgi:replicative DNA helicase
MSQTPSRYYEAQIGVLGSMLIDGAHTAGLVMQSLQPEDFTGPNRTIFDVCRELFRAGRPVDPVPVSQKLGPEYKQMLLDIMELTPTAANVREYITLTVEQSKLAKLKDLGTSLVGCVDAAEAQSLLAQANRIAGGRPSVRVVSMEQGLLDFYERQRTEAVHIPWGLPKVDGAMMSEFGDFIILGGEPSTGKTALSLQMAWTQAQTHRVGYFSLETKPEKIVDRAVSAAAGVDFGRIKRHKMDPEDWEACEARSSSMVGRKLEIIQAGGLSVLDIQAMTAAGRYEIIYIDYIQLVAPEDRRRSDFEQVTQISKDLHTLAQTTGVTVIALSQLTRPKVTGNKVAAPGMHSLRQSGQLEQDADGVLLMYLENPNDPSSRRRLQIAKNKEGEAGGGVWLVFDGAHQRFRESLVQAAKPIPDKPVQTAFYDIPGSVPLPFDDLEEDKDGMPF